MLELLHSALGADDQGAWCWPRRGDIWGDIWDRSSNTCMWARGSTQVTSEETGRAVCPGLGQRADTWVLVTIPRQAVFFNHSGVSGSLRPHEPQHTRPPWPSPTPRVHPNSCPSSGWCHPTISSSVIPFPFCPQSLPASESFPMSQLFAWGGQSTGASALASIYQI